MIEKIDKENGCNLIFLIDHHRQPNSLSRTRLILFHLFQSLFSFEASFDHGLSESPRRKELLSFRKCYTLALTFHSAESISLSLSL